MAFRAPVGRRVWLNGSQIRPRPRNIQPCKIVHVDKQLASIGTHTRPILPFLATPRTRSSVLIRTYASERTKQWLKQEFKLFVRLAALFWGGAVCLFVIHYCLLEEKLEREYPTPHEWSWRTRKRLRDAHKWKDPKHKPITWARTLDIARNLLLLLEDPNLDGTKIPRLTDHEEPNLEVPWEFIPHDISGMSEEWRRGYFDASMLAAKAAEHVDGWLRDVKRGTICPPDVVIGPSNPRPKPVPPGQGHAPREEDCEIAFPTADRYYLKILATQGFTPRQRIEAILEYASFLEYKNRPDGAESLYKLALAEATQGMEPSKLPYQEGSFVLKDSGPAPTLNVLDSITAIANHKVKGGDISGALAIYLSLLKARRSLSNVAPPTPRASKPKNRSPFQQAIDLFSEPEFPPPPPDGNQPPWRSAEERCQEAALHIWIGEILYTTKSREDGLAWTREGVDVAEEQLRVLPLKASVAQRGVKKTCRECLKTGLDNWSLMVEKLVAEDKLRREKEGSKSSMLSFWGSGSQQAEGEPGGRWDAERNVVEERVRRTQELLDDTTPHDEGFMSWYKA